MHNGLVDHNLIDDAQLDPRVKYTLRPVRDAQGRPVPDLFSAWIVLDNEKQLNSYTTGMVKSVILAFRRASVARDVVAVVFTGAGDRAFCTGGNTKEYAEYYSGRPGEYHQYMRLFNDMVSGILACDKPVICRVNGMRVGGGQEIGMACDVTLASDMAIFGQAGPKHGSAPDGGATDFLPLFVGIEQAMLSCTLCDPWSAYAAQRLGLVAEVVPVLKANGAYVPNPLVVTERWIDERGRIVYGAFKEGAEKERAQRAVAGGTVDLSALDEAVERHITKFAYTMPGCLSRTVGSIRKHKLEHWDRNRESSRDWLALNMMTEAKAGFRAFNEGPKGNREVDFLRLRALLAKGEPWSDALLDQVMPKAPAEAKARAS
jgi:6-oxo-cyclohex-1-ene-carbonyl-CoA hydrolase